jgi:hypothetical protein
MEKPTNKCNCLRVSLNTHKSFKGMIDGGAVYRMIMGLVLYIPTGCRGFQVHEKTPKIIESHQRIVLTMK